MICYIYIHCEMMSTIKLINISSTSQLLFLSECLGSTLSKFQLYNSASNYSHHAAHQIFRTYSSYNWECLYSSTNISFPPLSRAWQPPFYSGFLGSNYLSFFFLVPHISPSRISSRFLSFQEFSHSSKLSNLLTKLFIIFP